MRIRIIELPSPIDPDQVYRLKRTSEKTLTVGPTHDGDLRAFTGLGPAIPGDDDWSDPDTAWLEWIVERIVERMRKDGEWSKKVLERMQDGAWPGWLGNPDLEYTKREYRRIMREWIKDHIDRVPHEDEVNGGRKSIAPEALRTRIELLYMYRKGADDATEAVKWFAHQAKVRADTVRRWLRGEREPGGPVIAVLELLEEQTYA